MLNKGGYVAYAALIVILLRIAKKCKPSHVLMIEWCNSYRSQLAKNLVESVKKSKL